YKIIHELKPHQAQYPDVNTVLEAVVETLNIKPDEKLRNDLKYQLKSFKRFCQDKHKISFEERLNKLEGLIVLDSEHYSAKLSGFVSPDPEIRKTFIDVGRITKLARTQHLVDALESFVEKDGKMSIPQLIGYLLYITQYMKDRKIADLGCKLYNETYTNNEFSLDEAIAVMHSLVLSKEQLRLMKNMLKSKNIYFPNTNELLEARKRMRPTISSTPDNKGVMVDYKTLVKQTVEAHVLQAEKEHGMFFSCTDKLEVGLKDGCDGAGSQSVMKSKSALGAASNMFVYGIVPLHVKVNDCMIWKNPAPNSPEFLRPVYLVREKENDPVLINYVIQSTDSARDTINSNGLVVNTHSIAINTSVVIKDTMKDLKLKKSLSGLGGADCIICATKQDEWMIEERIKEGFAITRSAEETLCLYQSLVNEDGQVPKKQKDFKVRKGLTKQPITTSDQHSICITHSFINVTTWFLKLLYRLNQDYLVWRESKTVLEEYIRKGKDNVYDIILKNTGMALDVVQQSNSHGGTSTDGNSGRRFFSVECVTSIKLCTKEKYHRSVLHLHLLLSTILRVISSQHQVNISAFDEVCKEASLLIATYFKWVKVNYTLHGVLHHSTELIALNDGYSLGSLSEEGLEAANKHIRIYLETHARKTSVEDQMVDVMARLLERSHPDVLKNKIQFKRKPVQCLECGARTHSSSYHKLGPLTEIDSLVESLLIK
ncbi:unnamed protein product, partial [Meganyctiphanes norvegica]